MAHAAAKPGWDDGSGPLLRLPGLAQITFIVLVIAIAAAIATAVTVRSGEEDQPGPPSSLAGIASEGQTLGSRDAPVEVTAWVDMTAVGSNATIERLLEVTPAVRRGEVSLRLNRWDVLGVATPHAALYDGMRYLGPILASAARGLELGAGAWGAEPDPPPADEARALGFAHPPAILVEGPSGTATVTGAPDAGELRTAIHRVSPNATP